MMDINDIYQSVDKRGTNVLTDGSDISVPYSICPDNRVRLYKYVSDYGFELIHIADDIFDAREYIVKVL